MGGARHGLTCARPSCGCCPTWPAPKEIQQYLKRFSQLDAARFAVVKVGGAVLRDELEALVSVARLPAAGRPDADRAARCRPAARRGDGRRRHREARPWMACGHRRARARPSCGACRSRKTCAWWRRCRRRACAPPRSPRGVFEAELARRSAVTAWSARSTRVDTAPASRPRSRCGSIPVIASLGETAGGQILNVNADWAANELVKTLQPYKIIFLTGTGGLLDGEGELIDSINLSTEYEALLAQPWLHSGMRVKIEQIHDLLMHLPPSSLGLDHAPRRAGQGAVHAPRLGHPGAPRREDPRRRGLAGPGPGAAARADRIRLRAQARARLLREARRLPRVTSASTTARRWC